MQGLAQAFTAQQGVNNYSEDVAIIDLITKHRDDILVPLGMTTKTFLAAYKAANNLQVIPSPTINFDFQGLLDKINNVIGTNNMGEFDVDGENTTTTSKWWMLPMWHHSRWKELEEEWPSVASSTMPFSRAP